MTDYVWGPITTDVDGKYIWNTGPGDWNTAADWLQGDSLAFGSLTPGDVPGSGSGASDGSQDNVTLNAGQFLGLPASYSSTTFPVDVVIGSGVVVLDNLTLAGFNSGAGRGSARWPTLAVHGATLIVNGSIGDSSKVDFFPFPRQLPASGGGEIDLGGGATVEIGGAVASDVSFAFEDGADNTLALGTVTSDATPFLFGFTETNNLDLTSVKFTGGQPQLVETSSPLWWNASPPYVGYVHSRPVLDYYTLSIAEGGVTYTFNLDAATSGRGFLAMPDASGEGTLIIDIACYRRGARIATARGEVAVEDLSVGDTVLTAGGGTRPIRWIGSRRVECSRHPDPRAVWPVRIAAHAFGENQPRRDLWVSPGHNLFVNGALIPAIALANGVTLAQVPDDSVAYYHVELDAHDILLAENLPAESFLDCGNRSAFANSDGPVALFPDFARTRPGESCHPVCATGPRVEAAKAALLERARASGFTTTGDADLHLRADGARIDPTTHGGRHAFDVPEGARTLRLVSRVWSPGHMSPESSDARALGVLVTRLEVDGVARDLATLGDGWREVESPAWRWTGGDAALPAGARIVVDVDGEALYWRPRGAEAELFGAACLSA